MYYNDLASFKELCSLASHSIRRGQHEFLVTSVTHHCFYRTRMLPSTFSRPSPGFIVEVTYDFGTKWHELVTFPDIDYAFKDILWRVKVDLARHEKYLQSIANLKSTIHDLAGKLQ